MLIGILKLSAMGDIIWTLPMVQRLRRRYPEAKILYITSPPFTGLMEQVAGIEVITLKKPRSMADFLRLRKKMRPYVFDILICAQTSMRANFIYSCLKAHRKIGFDQKRAPFGNLFFKERVSFRDEHMLEGFLGFSDYLKALGTGIDYGFAGKLQTDLSLPKNFIVIHPCASTGSKTWAQRRYKSLIQALSVSYHGKIVITGSHKDRSFVAPLLTEKNTVDLVGKTPLPQLMAVLKKADCVVCPDTGPIHLADSLGVPVVGLYGCLPARLTGPFGQQENCIDVYAEAARKLFPGKTLRSLPPQQIRKKGAMDLISVNAVLKKIENSLLKQQ